MTTTKQNLEVERVEDRNIPELIISAWGKLLDQNETKTVELTHAWEMTYLDQLASDSRLYLLVVREAGEIVAIAPLKLGKTWKFGIPIRYLEFIAAEESDYQDFIIGRRHEEVLASILEFLMLHRSQWDVLYLKHVPEHSTTARFFLDPLNMLNSSVVSRVVGVRKCIFLEIKQTWKQYCADSAKIRKKIAYYKRKLQKLGTLTSFHCSNGQDFETNLAQFFDLHRRRWNGTHTPSKFNDERYCRFYLNSGLRLLMKKQIDLFMLEVGEKPIAGLITLRYDKDIIQHLTAYDPAYAPFSPSLVMHELYVEDLFANEERIFDFGNHHTYKETWANSFKNKLDIKVHLGGLIPSYDHLVSTLLQELRVRIRKRDALLKAARYVQYRWQRLTIPRSRRAGQ
jgi:CelD/BcsL family acetyltransferase involved in cellulose biosynthesis